MTPRELKARVDSFLLCLYCVGYLILTLLPMAKYSVSYIISGTYCLVPVALVFLKFPEWRTNIFVIGATGLFCGIIVYLLENGGLSEVVNIPINFLRFFMPCLLFFVLSRVPAVYKWVVWIIAAVIMIFVTVKTLDAIDTNDMIARLLAQGDTGEKITTFRMENIGGFGFCYAVGLTFPLWISTIIDTKNKWVKGFAIVLAILTFWFVLKVQYMILLIMCVFTVLLAIIFRPVNAFKKMFAVIFIVFLIMLMPLILRLITQLNIGQHIAGKIENVAAFLDGSVTAGSTTNRVNLYKDAFFEFLHSPVWGVAQSVQAPICHSTWLTLACTSGLFGIASFAYMISVVYKGVLKIMSEHNLNKIPFVVTFITLVVLAFFNPVNYAYEISLVVFLFVPLTMLLFGEKKEGKKNAELGA